MTVRRVAAIDCGTNSIRLLVADVDLDAGTLVDLDRRMDIVRLGQGVDRTGELAPEALDRTFAACERYGEAVRHLGAERVRFVATSASRDARNRDAFVAGVMARLGVEPEVVTGTEEATLSFTGAVRGLDLSGVRPPYLVVDIGGGSTEFVLGTDRPEASRSVDVGCVRLTERHLRHDPPTPDELAAVRADADAAIDLAAEAVPLDRAGALVGVAGTVTTLAAIAAGLDHYDPRRTHGARLPAEQVEAIAARLASMDHDTRAAIPVMHPGRVDVIVAGAAVLERIVARTGVAEVVVSEHDILDGIAWSAAAG